jgi:hypothetical protein
MQTNPRAHLKGMSVADFRDHIRQMKRAGEGFTILGAPRASAVVVRKSKKQEGK